VALHVGIHGRVHKSRPHAKRDSVEDFFVLLEHPSSSTQQIVPYTMTPREVRLWHRLGSVADFPNIRIAAIENPAHNEETGCPDRRYNSLMGDSLEQIGTDAASGVGLEESSKIRI
jgi:hypothetical protein